MVKFIMLKLNRGDNGVVYSGRQSNLRASKKTFLMLCIVQRKDLKKIKSQKMEVIDGEDKLGLELVSLFLFECMFGLPCSCKLVTHVMPLLRDV